MLDPSSPVVCQIPDCATTQAEIESELKQFLSGYCSVCKRDRQGKLCGCAFPCSLTFRAQMMHKIHELLGLERTSSRKAIQVCFKHPDLLKQAREACVAKKEGHGRSTAAGHGGNTATAATPAAATVAATGTSTGGSFSGGYSGRGLAMAMTSSSPMEVAVATAKRGSTGGSGRGRGRGRGIKRIEDQDGSPQRPGGEGSKMMKIQFGTTLDLGGGQRLVVGGEDDANDNGDDFECLPITPPEKPTTEHSESKSLDSMSRPKMTKLKFHLGTEEDDSTSGSNCSLSEDDDVVEDVDEVKRKQTQQFAETAYAQEDDADDDADDADDDNAGDADDDNEDEEDDIECSSDGKSESSDSVDGESDFTGKDAWTVHGVAGGTQPKLLKIEYENYSRKVLSHEVGHVVKDKFLSDVHLVCKGGSVVACSSLILAAISEFFREVLVTARQNSPEKVTIVLMPEVRAEAVETFFSFLFRERSLDQADEKQLQRIRQISKLLRIDFLPWNRKTKLCNRQFEERSNNNESERAPDRTTTESVDGVEDLAENRPPVVQKTPMTSSKKRRRSPAKVKKKPGRPRKSPVKRGNIHEDDEEDNPMPLLSQGTRSRGRKRKSVEGIRSLASPSTPSAAGLTGNDEGVLVLATSAEDVAQPLNDITTGSREESGVTGNEEPKAKLRKLEKELPERKARYDSQQEDNSEDTSRKCAQSASEPTLELASTRKRIHKEATKGLEMDADASEVKLSLSSCKSHSSFPCRRSEKSTTDEESEGVALSKRTPGVPTRSRKKKWQDDKKPT